MLEGTHKEHKHESDLQDLSARFEFSDRLKFAIQPINRYNHPITTRRTARMKNTPG